MKIRSMGIDVGIWLVNWQVQFIESPVALPYLSPDQSQYLRQMGAVVRRLAPGQYPA